MGAPLSFLSQKWLRNVYTLHRQIGILCPVEEHGPWQTDRAN